MPGESRYGRTEDGRFKSKPDMARETSAERVWFMACDLLRASQAFDPARFAVREDLATEVEVLATSAAFLDPPLARRQGLYVEHKPPLGA